MRLRPYWDKLRLLVRSSRFERAGRRAALGRNVRILGKVRISIGDRSAIRDNVILGGNGRLAIGNRTAINDGCILSVMESVTIGDDVMLAPRVYVLDVDHRFGRRDIPIARQGYTTAPVRIGDGAWIGTGAVVTKGVTIGEGAIIGANSVVTRDIPPYAIAVGVPARVVRERP